MKRKLLLPEGVQDLLIDDCIYRRHLEDKLMKGLIQAGYMEVSSPNLEYYDLFSEDYLDANGDNMFKLIDSNGKILVLRPDGTIPIVRMLSTKMRDFVYPLKLSYIKDIFRTDEEQAGKKREYRQAGVELFGIPSFRGDAEVIITAIESLRDLGLEGFQVELGQVELLRAILENQDLSSDERKLIYKYMENKDVIGIGRFVETISIDKDIKTILKKLPMLFGKPNEVLEQVNGLPLDPSMIKAVKDLEKVWVMLKSYGLGQYISFDLGMVPNMEYYSGIIFKGFTKDLGSVLLSGGRYDRLLEDFGMICPATGFALITNRITKALKIQNKLKIEEQEHILILEDESNRLTADMIKDLRDKGYVVEICLLKDPSAIKEYAKPREVDKIIKLDSQGDWEIVEDLGGSLDGDS
ncbi:MAG TPA: ATP phosphoribosyltransferase regulatory subunit [Tissierellaceae bacterium]|nr:ATP phosphoribosyltransferase regulatory subunit [Tissierellaceae bacterium]